MTVGSVDAKKIKEINKQLQEWVEISQSTLNKSQVIQDIDASVLHERSENILTVSQSLRKISKQVREFAATARQQAKEQRQNSVA